MKRIAKTADGKDVCAASGVSEISGPKATSICPRHGAYVGGCRPCLDEHETELRAP